MEPSAQTQSLLFQCLLILLRVTLFIKKRKRSDLESLPKELQSDIVARVAANSYADYVSIKRSCKLMKEVAQGSHVLKHVTLDEFPMVKWHQMHKEEYDQFLDQCAASENPEALYRKGLVKYFLRNNVVTVYECFTKSIMSSNHAGAYYTMVMMLLLDGDDCFQQGGILLLNEMTNSKVYLREIRFYRYIMIELLRANWARNPCPGHVFFRRTPPFCCKNRRHRHIANDYMTSASFFYIDMEYMKCDACTCDRELTFICNSLP